MGCGASSVSVADHSAVVGMGAFLCFGKALYPPIAVLSPTIYGQVIQSSPPQSVQLDAEAAEHRPLDHVSRVRGPRMPVTGLSSDSVRYVQ